MQQALKSDKDFHCATMFSSSPRDIASWFVRIEHSIQLWGSIQLWDMTATDDEHNHLDVQWTQMSDICKITTVLLPQPFASETCFSEKTHNTVLCMGPTAKSGPCNRQTQQQGRGYNTCWGCHHVLELSRMLAALQHHFCRPEYCLCS